MVDIPINTDFMLMDEITLKEDNDVQEFNIEEDVIKYYFSGVPYEINMYGKKTEIYWQPNSLKQAIDLSFGFMICSEKNPLKICKHCGKVFYANIFRRSKSKLHLPYITLFLL